QCSLRSGGNQPSHVAQRGRHPLFEPRGQPAGAQHYSEQPGPGQGVAQRASNKPFAPWPLIILFDIGAPDVHQVHVVDLDRAGRHARHAREASIDIPDGFRRWATALLQHFLDEVDAASRAVVFIVQQGVGGTARGAKAEVLAGAQYLVGLGNVGPGQLNFRKTGFHLESGGFYILSSSPIPRPYSWRLTLSSWGIAQWQCARQYSTTYFEALRAATAC